MNGTGVPLVTPFDADGAIDEARLRDLVGWLEARGVDFLVPCGSTGEAALMGVDERQRVVEVVVEAASVPVVPGTGHPGYRETERQTARAAAAGADAALVVTPFYYRHDQATLAAHYRALADAADCPIYCYSVPQFTGVHLEPVTVGELSAHPNLAGIKDSSGNLGRLQRTVDRVADDFDVFTGAGGVYAHALDAGAAGGILALANLAPERTARVEAHHREGDRAAAHRVNRELVELNHATTAVHGVPGLKAAMRARGAPAGETRGPHRRLDGTVGRELEGRIEALGLERT